MSMFDKLVTFFLVIAVIVGTTLITCFVISEYLSDTTTTPAPCSLVTATRGQPGAETVTASLGEKTYPSPAAR